MSNSPTEPLSFTDMGISSDLEIKLRSFDYHRNGVSGAGFWVFLLDSRETGKGRNAGYSEGWTRKVAILFDPAEVDHSCPVAVLDQDVLMKDDIRFGFNSWRGDRYVDALRYFVKESAR